MFTGYLVNCQFETRQGGNDADIVFMYEIFKNDFLKVKAKPKTKRNSPVSTGSKYHSHKLNFIILYKNRRLNKP